MYCCHKGHTLSIGCQGSFMFGHANHRIVLQRPAHPANNKNKDYVPQQQTRYMHRSNDCIYIYMYTCANGQRMTLYTADTQETVSNKQVLTCRKLSSFQHQFDLKRKRKIQLTSHKHNFPIPSTRRFHGYTVDTEKQCQTNNFTMSKTTQTQIFDNKSQISMSPSKQQVVFINVCRWLKCMCLHPKVFARGLLPVIVGMRRSVTEETKDFLQSNKTKKTTKTTKPKHQIKSKTKKPTSTGNLTDLSEVFSPRT